MPATDSWDVERVAAITASVAPTAKPTSAADRAAMSLMPSPQNIVVWPNPCAACSSLEHHLICYQASMQGAVICLDHSL